MAEQVDSSFYNKVDSEYCKLQKYLDEINLMQIRCADFCLISEGLVYSTRTRNKHIRSNPYRRQLEHGFI